MSVKTLLEMLAYKFKRDFPLIEGLIIKANGSEIFVDLGMDEGIRNHSRLIIFKEGSSVIHPDTGKLLAPATIEIGEAKVRDVFKEYLKASVIKQIEPFKIKDRVITK
jgi:hypothetical protein